MTKTHFEAIAKTIRTQAEEVGDSDEWFTVKSTAIRLAATFAEINPRFNPQTFLTACGF